MKLSFLYKLFRLTCLTFFDSFSLVQKNQHHFLTDFQGEIPVLMKLNFKEGIK